MKNSHLIKLLPMTLLAQVYIILQLL